MYKNLSFSIFLLGKCYLNLFKNLDDLNDSVIKFKDNIIESVVILSLNGVRFFVNIEL